MVINLRYWVSPAYPSVLNCLIIFFLPFLQDDGAIRVWKNFADLEKNPEMVTAWQGLSDMLPTTRGRYDLAFYLDLKGQK